MTKKNRKYCYKISLRDTLRRLVVGDSIIIPERDFSSTSVRNAARLLEKEEGLKYEVSNKNLILETRVTRL